MQYLQLFVISVACLSHTACAWGSGATAPVCEDGTPGGAGSTTHGMLGSGDGGFALTFDPVLPSVNTYLPGTSYTITLSGATFNGFAISPLTDETGRIFPKTNSKTLVCPDRPNADALTHTSSRAKASASGTWESPSSGDARFRWTAFVGGHGTGTWYIDTLALSSAFGGPPDTDMPTPTPSPSPTSRPGIETPAPDTPPPSQPEAPSPETPTPETPEPETPSPETPTPETPEPETPSPSSPGTSSPKSPAPETPAPTKLAPTPVPKEPTPAPPPKKTGSSVLQGEASESSAHDKSKRNRQHGRLASFLSASMMEIRQVFEKRLVGEGHSDPSNSFQKSLSENVHADL